MYVSPRILTGTISILFSLSLPNKLDPDSVDVYTQDLHDNATNSIRVFIVLFWIAMWVVFSWSLADIMTYAGAFYGALFIMVNFCLGLDIEDVD